MAKVKSAGNVIPTYNSVPLTAYCDQANLQSVVASIDVTDFASTANEYITGFAEWTVPMGGDWDPTLDAALAPDVVTPGTPRTFSLAFDDGEHSVTYTWTDNCNIENYSVESGDPTQAIRWSATMRLSGAPLRAAT